MQISLSVVAAINWGQPLEKPFDNSNLSKEYAFDLCHKGYWSDALLILEQILDADPTDKLASESVNTIRQDVMNAKSDIPELQEVLRYDPNNAPQRYKLAKYLLATGDKEGAAREWKKVADLDSPNYSKSASKMLRKHFSVIT